MNSHSNPNIDEPRVFRLECRPVFLSVRVHCFLNHQLFVHLARIRRLNPPYQKPTIFVLFSSCYLVTEAALSNATDINVTQCRGTFASSSPLLTQGLFTDHQVKMEIDNCGGSSGFESSERCRMRSVEIEKQKQIGNKKEVQVELADDGNRGKAGGRWYDAGLRHV